MTTIETVTLVGKTKPLQKGLSNVIVDGDSEEDDWGNEAQGDRIGQAQDVVTGLPWSFSALSQFEARVHRLTSTRPVSVYTCGSLDEREWELLRKNGAASDLALDGQLLGDEEKPIDWNKGLAEMRAAGVTASGDALDEHDLRALWQRAEGVFAPLAPPAAVVPLAARLTAARPDQAREGTHAEEQHTGRAQCAPQDERSEHNDSGVQPGRALQQPGLRPSAG